MIAAWKIAPVEVLRFKLSTIHMGRGAWVRSAASSQKKTNVPRGLYGWLRIVWGHEVAA